LVHKIESCRAAIRCRRPSKALDVFVSADGSSQTALRHVVRDLCGITTNKIMDSYGKRTVKGSWIIPETPRAVSGLPQQASVIRVLSSLGCSLALGFG